MRKAILVFGVAFAAVVGVGVLFLDLSVPAGPPGGGPAVKKPPGVPAVGAFTPAGYAEYVTAYPDELGGPAEARSMFLRRAVQQGQATAAYRAVGPAEADEAFRELGDGLVTAKSAAALRELLAAHGDRGDPLADVYAARMLVWDKKLAAAGDRLIRTAGRLEAARRWAAAGRHFEAVFWPLHWDEPAAADRLLAAWSDHGPDDFRRNRCRMFADLRRKEYDGCLTAAERYLAAAPAGDLYRYDAGLMRVRALAYLGRFTEADAALAGIDPPKLTAWLKDHAELLIALLAGDDGRADRLLGSGRVEPAAAYADQLLGPLMRSDRAAGLREKHPPPAGGPGQR